MRDVFTKDVYLIAYYDYVIRNVIVEITTATSATYKWISESKAKYAYELRKACSKLCVKA